MAYYTFDCVPRRELLATAEFAEYAARLNDHKGGWFGCTTQWLVDKLSEEIDEFYADWDGGAGEVNPKELADIIVVASALLGNLGVLENVRKYALFRSDISDVCSTESVDLQNPADKGTAG